MIYSAISTRIKLSCCLIQKISLEERKGNLHIPVTLLQVLTLVRPDIRILNGKDSSLVIINSGSIIISTSMRDNSFLIKFKLSHRLRAIIIFLGELVQHFIKLFAICSCCNYLNCVLVIQA